MKCQRRPLGRCSFGFSVNISILPKALQKDSVTWIFVSLCQCEVTVNPFCPGRKFIKHPGVQVSLGKVRALTSHRLKLLCAPKGQGVVHRM